MEPETNAEAIATVWRRSQVRTEKGPSMNVPGNARSHLSSARAVIAVVGLVAALLVPLTWSSASATTCDDWAPNTSKVNLCKLGLLKPPPEPEEPPNPAWIDAQGCGDPVYKSDGSPWTCTFADNFDGDSLNPARWVSQPAGFKSGDDDNIACYVDDPSTIAVGGGDLTLSVVKGANDPCPTLTGNPSTPYRAGSVTTYHLFSQQYGRFEAKIKATPTTETGLQESFWLWPDDRFPAGQGIWPANGEIDIAETYSQYPQYAIPFLHSLINIPIVGYNTAQTCPATRGGWNTYTLEWSASKIQIFVNGALCLKNPSGDVAFKKRYIITLTQLLGAGGNAVTANTPFPASTQVDYVKVWQ